MQQSQTPSGVLLHGIMSSIAEFYSRNLAAESKKGMRQKVKNGGTAGMAPFGYINTRIRNDGREVRTVELDPERAEWVPWLYERYASGDWTAAALRDELNRRGVMTRPRPNRPSRMIATSHIHAILRNRYYLGFVTFEGVEYPGQHEALVSEELFQRVQRMRAARAQSKEKPRVFNHYLKGSVFCGQCGEPLTFARSRNRQGHVYDYFICIGRNSHKNGCTFRAIEVAQLERLVLDHWKTVAMKSTHVAQIRALLLEHMGIVLPSSAANREMLDGELGSVDRDSQKVLEAYYADAIDVQELKNEQRRLAVRRGAIEAESSKHKFDEGVITRSLELCLDLLTSGQKHYEQADKLARRELNQAMFEHLYVDDDEIVASDMNEAFRRLISEDLAVELESERKTHQKPQTRTSGLYAVPGVDGNAHRGGEQGSWDLPPRARRTRPEDRIRPFLTLERPRGHLSWEKKEPRPSEDRGSNDLLLVAGTGFEPVTSG